MIYRKKGSKAPFFCYRFMIKVPGIGERVVKWFGTMRPVDLNSYVF